MTWNEGHPAEAGCRLAARRVQARMVKPDTPKSPRAPPPDTLQRSAAGQTSAARPGDWLSRWGRPAQLHEAPPEADGAWRNLKPPSAPGARPPPVLPSRLPALLGPRFSPRAGPGC